MTGNELKNILANSGFQQKDIAEKLQMSQQNFAASLKVRDIKSGFLEQICDSLNVTMDFFYRGTKYSPTVSITASGDQSIATNSGDIAYNRQTGNNESIGVQNNYGCKDKKDNVTTLTDTVATLTRELETSQQQKSSLIEIVATSQEQIKQLTDIINRLTTI